VEASNYAYINNNAVTHLLLYSQLLQTLVLVTMTCTYFWHHRLI